MYHYLDANKWCNIIGERVVKEVLKKLEQTIINVVSSLSSIMNKYNFHNNNKQVKFVSALLLLSVHVLQ